MAQRPVTDEGLRREIGVLGLSANVINITVGAGIFLLPALVAQGLGSASLLAYLSCGVLIVVVMLCFAEAGSKVTVSGGAYSYIEAAFGDYAGFLAINLFVFASAAASDAAVVNGLLDTLSVPLPVLEAQVVRVPIIVALFMGLALVNIRGVKQGIGLVKICTVGKLMPLLVLVLFGWTGVTTENLAWDGLPGIRDLGEMSLLLFFAFQGAESALSVGGEIRNPRRTVPLALLSSIGIILVLYILIQTICQGVLGDALSSHTEAPLAETAGKVFGGVGFSLMLVGGAVSMFGNLSGEMLNLPRMVFGAARDGVIPPRALASVHPRFATPHVSILLYMIVVIVLATTGGFRELAILSSSSMLLIYLGVALAVIRLGS